jgi:hypothetical protein
VGAGWGLGFKLRQCLALILGRDHAALSIKNMIVCSHEDRGLRIHGESEKNIFKLFS